MVNNDIVIFSWPCDQTLSTLVSWDVTGCIEVILQWTITRYQMSKRALQNTFWGIFFKENSLLKYLGLVVRHSPCPFLLTPLLSSRLNVEITLLEKLWNLAPASYISLQGFSDFLSRERGRALDSGGKRRRIVVEAIVTCMQKAWDSLSNSWTWPDQKDFKAWKEGGVHLFGEKPTAV